MHSSLLSKSPTPLIPYPRIQGFLRKPPTILRFQQEKSSISMINNEISLSNNSYLPIKKSYSASKKIQVSKEIFQNSYRNHSQEKSVSYKINKKLLKPLFDYRNSIQKILNLQSDISDIDLEDYPVNSIYSIKFNKSRKK